MRKPPEITDDKWEMLTSPENYFCDGEVTRAQADRIFRQRVSVLVQRRRVTPPQRGSGRRCAVVTMNHTRCRRSARPGSDMCTQHWKACPAPLR